jgi:hypothetical protein
MATKASLSFGNDQEVHHSRLSFEEDFKALLKWHGLEFAEKYIWIWIRSPLRGSGSIVLTQPKARKGINILDASVRLFHVENAEGVGEFQPRATPWEAR